MQQTKPTQPTSELPAHVLARRATVVAFTQRKLVKATAIIGEQLDLSLLRFDPVESKHLPSIGGRILCNHLDRHGIARPDELLLIHRGGSRREAGNALLEAALGCGRGIDKHGAILFVRHLTAFQDDSRGALVLRLSHIGNATWQVLSWRETPLEIAGVSFVDRFHLDHLPPRGRIPVSLHRVLKARHSELPALSAIASHYFEKRLNPRLRDGVILHGAADAFLQAKGPDVDLIKPIVQTALWREPELHPFYPIKLSMAPNTQPVGKPHVNLNDTWRMLSGRAPDGAKVLQETIDRIAERLRAIVRRHGWSPTFRDKEMPFTSGMRTTHWRSRPFTLSLTIESPTGHDAFEAASAPDVI